MTAHLISFDRNDHNTCSESNLRAIKKAPLMVSFNLSGIMRCCHFRFMKSLFSLLLTASLMLPRQKTKCVLKSIGEQQIYFIQNEIWTSTLRNFCFFCICVRNDDNEANIRFLFEKLLCVEWNICVRRRRRTFSAPIVTLFTITFSRAHSPASSRWRRCLRCWWRGKYANTKFFSPWKACRIQSCAVSRNMSNVQRDGTCSLNVECLRTNYEENIERIVRIRIVKLNVCMLLRGYHETRHVRSKFSISQWWKEKAGEWWFNNELKILSTALLTCVTGEISCIMWWNISVEGKLGA